MSEAPAATTVHRGLPRGPVLVLLLTLATLLPRLAELPTAREGRMPPDAAHFLNVARCFSRGQGFSNPAAWPAWMKPDRLPMPETFKEPGYPFLIALLSRTGFTPFRAGLALSLIAGLLLPFAILALGRQVHPDPAVGFVAALIAAGSPLLVDKSVTVIVESLFALAITLLFLSAALGVRGPSREARPLALDVLTGALFGAAWLLRAQTLLALPALLLLFVQGRSWRRVAPRLLAAALAAGLVLSPFIARNLRLFGVPFYSDVPAFGIWPYVDHVTFSNGLARPPAPLGYALAHPLAILRHALWSAWHFGASALPRELYGDPLWALACAVGLVLGVRRWREQGFAFAYVGLTVAFILCVHWDTYYFTSSMVGWALLAGIGAVEVVGRVDAGRARPIALPVVLVLALMGPLVVAIVRPARVAAFVPEEIEAAQHEAPFLRARLAPGEAVMVERTSYWAWFLDRPAVHVVVADSTSFLERVRTLEVRWAVLPESAIPDLAAHYPGGRLPAALVLDHVDAARGVRVYRVVDPEATPEEGRPDLP
ncbi:MAG TPA: hypothetical protein VL332_02415 [Candidatus Saccharimonadaceae bacterium]|nr:hypothetical protein [Candidatus Saccharimonadaceae bacterium]